MTQRDKTYSILQVEFANRSEGRARKLLRGDETYHARLVMRDDASGQELAALTFSPKNAHGKTINFASFRPANALRVIADCFGLGRAYDVAMDHTPLAGSVPRLKGVLVTPDHAAHLTIAPEHPHEVRFTGNEDEALLVMESLCNATEQLNRSGVVFTSVGLRSAANNCRAGTKAVSDASGLEFTELHRRANLGAGSSLSSKLALSAQGGGREVSKGDIQTRLKIMATRLRASVRSVPDAPESASDPEFV